MPEVGIGGVALDVCGECGASVPPNGSCRDNFNAMLALEWEVGAPAPAGQLAHFYAVSTYVLQHPDTMGYTVESLAWLRRSVSDMIADGVSVHELRKQARDQGEKSRVTRREGDPVPHWNVRTWTMTVVDVLDGGVDGYCERARQWADSALSDLDAADA